MRISELLTSIASWLASPNNEAILLSEYDDACMKAVAESCLLASQELSKCASIVEGIEPQEESKITPEALYELAEIATAFDASGNKDLQKQASVIDELILTIAAPKDFIANKAAADDKRIEDLKKKYETAKQFKELYKTDDHEKMISKSNATKEPDHSYEPLLSRYCPDHAGVNLIRASEDEYYCELDKKKYNYVTGFTKLDGTKVPGASVSGQGRLSYNDNNNYSTVFDTREGRLGSNK